MSIFLELLETTLCHKNSHHQNKADFSCEPLSKDGMTQNLKFPWDKLTEIWME